MKIVGRRPSDTIVKDGLFYLFIFYKVQFLFQYKTVSLYSLFTS